MSEKDYQAELDHINLKKEQDEKKYIRLGTLNPEDESTAIYECHDSILEGSCHLLQTWMNEDGDLWLKCVTCKELFILET